MVKYVAWLVVVQSAGRQPPHRWRTAVVREHTFYSFIACSTMRIKKHLLAFAVVPVMGLGLLGVSSASAHGFGWGGMRNATPQEIATNQQAMFEDQATLLGISTDDLKQKWSEGKDLRAIATELGISDEQFKEKMKAKHEAQVKSHVQALVEQGIITQAQADARLAALQTRMQHAPKGRGGMRGMHPGGPF